MVKMLSKQFVDFTLGLNYVDSELNMNPSYMTIARNIEIGYDSAVKKRNGFKLIANVWDYLRENETIQQVFYFSTFCFVYTTDGRVLSVDDDGEVYIEWDEFEAALQTTGIGQTVYIWNHPEKRCFGTTAGTLFILSNGYDKPLQINIGNRPASEKKRVKSVGNLTFDASVADKTFTFDGDLTGFGLGTIGFLTEDNDYYFGAVESITGNTIVLSTWYGNLPPNGTYKVTLVEYAGSVTYLHDPATTSNANVPYIYKCVMVNHYLCAICNTLHDGAVDTGFPDTKVYVSAKDSPGVWEGDENWKESGGAYPIDVSAIIQMDNQEIVDIDVVKGKLCVWTNYCFMLFNMDTYKVIEVKTDEQGNQINVEEHIPTLETVVENAGALTVGSVKSIFDSTAFLSMNGINSVKRNVVSQNFTPDSLSVKTLPYITRRLTESLVADGVTSLVDYRKFVYGIKFEDNTMLMMSFHPNLGSNKSFYVWDNIRYVSFTNNQYGKIVATDGYGVMVYSNDDEKIHKDTYIVNGKPVAENFEMEFQTPWLMYQAGSNVKSMEYVTVISDGTARFQLSSTFDLQDENEVQIEMLGGDREGYGSGSTVMGLISNERYDDRSLAIKYDGKVIGYVVDEEGADYGDVYQNGLYVRTLEEVYENKAVFYTNANPYYGGGIIASNLNLVDFNQTFMYNRFRIYSSDDLPLRIVRIGVQYKIGGIRR